MNEGDMQLTEMYALHEQDINEVRKRIPLILSQTDAHDNMRQLLVRTASTPGKLLRPLLVFLSAGAYPENTREELLCAATAAELMHIASLLHDDIIDKAETRRGVPSLCAQFGIPAALCAGDYLMIKSFAYLNDLGYHTTAGNLMTAALKVCDGELLQDEYQFNTSVSEEIYYDSIRGKTAAAFAECCAIGCRIAGRPASVQQVMKALGEVLGMMFQIRDDILDWTMDEKCLRKPVNEDFVNGIYTLPAIYTFRNEYYGSLLRTYTKKSMLSNKDTEEIRGIVSECGGIAYAKSVLNDFAQKALILLENVTQNGYNDVFRALVNQFRL